MLIVYDLIEKTKFGVFIQVVNNLILFHMEKINENI